MKALDYPLLTDENIQLEVVQTLLQHGKQVRTVWDEGLDSQGAAAGSWEVGNGGPRLGLAMEPL
jgi:hypothetical protein